MSSHSYNSCSRVAVLLLAVVAVLGCLGTFAAAQQSRRLSSEPRRRRNKRGRPSASIGRPPLFVGNLILPRHAQQPRTPYYGTPY